MTDALRALAQYAIGKGFIMPEDETWALNRLLEAMQLDAPSGVQAAEDAPLCDILAALTDDAVSRGLISGTVTERDLFDTKLMGVLIPPPRQVRSEFRALYELSPRAATDWYYAFSCSSNYIRTDRTAKDLRWNYSGKYGVLELSINLAKPEKDPKAIAAAGRAVQTGYPLCQLCAENEGYAGRLNHPARQNHRLIPVTVGGEDWFLQYSPYVYYNEHCIVLNSRHVPMKIDRAAFEKLFDFVRCFPHYFVGSNADLPIVGGSILSHEHFQGGRHDFPMAKAGIEIPVAFKGFEDVEAGIVKWPLSVIRLAHEDPSRLVLLGDRILGAWRGYSDEAAFIFSETDGVPHNTVTPIARFRGGRYELDLVLRNNITTDEHPLGVYHPHAKLHHIKKENIGLIEVMGLAILPGRLKAELDSLAEAAADGRDVRSDPVLAKHADWLDEIRSRRAVTRENASAAVFEETGSVFEQVLEDAGVYKTDEPGREAFMRFIAAVNS